MNTTLVRLLMLMSLLAAQSRAATVLESVLGTSAVTFDSTKLAQVKAAPYGTRFWYDTNSDGRPDEVWYIDIDPRHTSAKKPVLVKCIDQDGDLAVGIEGDHDSDLYIIDWTANGTYDRATEYNDYDHDNDMDMMAEYSTGGGVLWAYDVDDDNLLWYDQDYTYYQASCQDHCHYTGERTSILSFDSTNKGWLPSWESPFFFNDINKDGVQDEVLRVTVNPADTVATLRWSFNVKGIGTPDDPRNFDCSISAYPLANTKIQGTAATSTTLHGFPINSMLSYEQGIPWVRGLTWQKGCFTWVENDNNVGWNDSYTGERWEGVIGHVSTNFAQIGGPSCGPYNNRNELDLNPTGPFSYYYNPADHRIHLKGSDAAWLAVDWDGNFTQDMKYTYTDTNSDGYLDSVAFDSNNDGTAEDTWTLAVNQAQTLVYDWQTFRTAYAPVLQTYPAQLYELDRALAAALEYTSPGLSADSIWTLVENKFTNASIPEWKRQKFLNSDVSLIYYLELVRDRQIIKLKANSYRYYSFWNSFNAARSAGNMAIMASLVEWGFGPITPNWTPFATWIAALRTQHVQRVDSSGVWLPNGIAWETENAAWRIRGGRMDFLGKREKRLVLSEIKSSTNLTTDTGAWGMDALDEGSGPGSGGLTLFINGTAYPLYGDSMTSVTYRLIQQTNDRVVVEMLARNIGPVSAPRSVLVHAIAETGRPDTQFTATVSGGPMMDKLELGIGMMRPPENYYEHNKTAGILGIWGFQRPGIDWVGIGVIYPPAVYSRLATSPSELDVVLKARQNMPVDWIIRNDWRRGRRFSNWPVLANFMRELNATAATVTFPARTAAANWEAME